MTARLLSSTLILPALASALSLALSRPGVIALVRAGGLILAAWLASVACLVFMTGPLSCAGGWLFLDPLSAYHALVLALVFAASSVYAGVYFEFELANGKLNLHEARRFGALWFGALAAMTMVLVCGKLGLMWVGMEATTLITAFLICVHVRPLALEAMWKYLIVCSVGVAFAFVGTILIGASAQKLNLDAYELLLWPRLMGSAASLDPAFMKLAFVFLLVGYGTKAGLAPMHNWLPDAHSQAPAPVSALFSGFMLNAGLYCIMRCLPLVEGAMGGSGWAPHLLAAMGCVSILVAAAFIAFQRDAKRLLAYSSVEHMGIIALGTGLGGVGVFAALWHTLNHALCKPLAFFAAGRLGQAYGSHDLRVMAGSLRKCPWWGAGLFGSLLAIIGVAPFAIFMSELQILKAAADARAFWAMAIFLAGTCIVFVGALRHAMEAAWGESPADPKEEEADRSSKALILGGLGVLLVLGLWLPGPLFRAIDQAAAIVRGR
ncbi:MAG: proton-conducting transporter membrane subunit [candidate division NC10 bacterium]